MASPSEQFSHLLDQDRLLERQVANAADAWLNDPRDHEAYRRLVAAVLQRRAHLNSATPGIAPAAPEHAQPADAAGWQEPERFGDQLGGEARDVIDRLRGFHPAPPAVLPHIVPDDRPEAQSG